MSVLFVSILEAVLFRVIPGTLSVLSSLPSSQGVLPHTCASSADVPGQPSYDW